MKIVLFGDLGSNPGYHVGDEAMAESVVEELRSRGALEVVAMSGNERDTQLRYGWKTVPRLGFAGLSSDADRDVRLRRVGDAAMGTASALAWNDPAWSVIHAVAEADAVVFSGGGNLNSAWPEHVYERAALAEIAGAFAKRHVVTGQTIGPLLTARHGELAGRVLTSAALVGAREASSFAIAQRLGVLPERLMRVVDDAAFLTLGSSDEATHRRPYIVGSFAPSFGLVDSAEYVASIARLLDEISEFSGLPITLVPHQVSFMDQDAGGDLGVHRAIAEATRLADVEVLAEVSARRAAEVTRSSVLTIGSRYHSVVFSLAGGVPAIGIGLDAYATTKIVGAMENYGLEFLGLSAASLIRGELAPIVAEVLNRREAIAAHLDAVNRVRRSESRTWWDIVHDCLGGEIVGAVPFSAVDRFPGETLFPTAAALRDWDLRVSMQFEAARFEDEARIATTDRLKREVEGLERDRAELLAELALVRDEVDTLRVAGEAAYALVVERLEPYIDLIRDRRSIEALRSELDALYATRTFRMLEGPRRLYGRLRAR